AVALVKERVALAPVVVVSALSGVTNLLVDYAAAGADRAALSRAILDRHAAFVRDTGLGEEHAAAVAERWMPLHSRHAAVPGALDAAARDEVLAFGELASSGLFAAGLVRAGIAAR